MDGRKYQRKSGIKRTLVMLLALVMLASVCFPAMRVNAEETLECTCGTESEIHTADCPKYVAPQNGGEGDTQECNCNAENGVHIEGCPKYVAPQNGGEGDTQECNCNAENGVHIEGCPKYVEPQNDDEAPSMSDTAKAYLKQIEDIKALIENMDPDASDYEDQLEAAVEALDAVVVNAGNDTALTEEERAAIRSAADAVLMWQVDDPEPQSDFATEARIVFKQDDSKYLKINFVDGNGNPLNSTAYGNYEVGKTEVPFKTIAAQYFGDEYEFSHAYYNSSWFGGVKLSDIKYNHGWYANNGWTLIPNQTTIFLVYKPNGSGGGSEGTRAYFFIRDDGVIQPEPASYPNSQYIPVPYNASNPNSWTPIPNALPKNPSAISNNLTAVDVALQARPTDDQIKAALEANGKSYTPGSEYIVWYVIKNEDGDWHVDGVVRRHPFLHYNANGGDAATMPDSCQYPADTVVDVAFKNGQNGEPTREGYIFLGWADSPNDTTPYYTADGIKTLKMPSEDKTLYAVWKEENLSSGSGSLIITGEKCWDDKEDANQLRPDSITIQLQGSLDGTKWDDLGDPQTVQANPEGKWTYSFNASAYEYTQFRVREIDVPDKYKVTYTDPQVKFTYPAAGEWGNRVTECSTISFGADTSKTTIIVAKKGGSYVVWTYYPLTPGEQSLILSSLKGLNGENVKDSNCTFFYGIGAHSNGMTVTESEITFDGKSSWSYYSGAYTPTTASATTSTITNTLSTATVTITKQVKGNMGDPNKSFPFTVTLTDGTMTDGTYSEANGSVEYTVSEGGTKISFSLSHDQSVILQNVPLDAKLTVTETGADAYEVTIDGEKVKQKGATGSARKSDITVSADMNITVVNENEATIDTGIVTDSIPYILLLTMAVIGAGVLLLNKRRVF